MPDIGSSPRVHDPSPLYFRIAAGLRGDMAAGILAVGARLPPIAALARKYAVAPVTVRQALRLLSDEGLVRSRQGSGTFVASLPVQAQIRPEDLDWPLRAPALRQRRARILQADDSAPPLLPADGTPAPCYRRMLRVHMDADGTPMRLAELFVDRRCYEQAPKRFDTEMALALLEELHGPDLAEMRHFFTLTVADAFAAEHLGVRVGDPLGRLRRVLTRRTGEVVYFAVGLIRADWIALAWTSHRQG